MKKLPTNLKRTPCGTRAGFTLVELLASMAVMSIVLGGIASAMVLASRAIPDNRSPLATPLQGFHAAEEIAGDLVTASAFNVRTSMAVEFTVPDRDNNGGDELIRYEWSGTLGDPLMRTYNAGASTELASNVYEFNLAYWVATRTDHTTSETTTVGNEVPLASFESWPGIVATAQPHLATTDSWVAECFQIAPPAGATELIFTQAKITMRRDDVIPAGSPTLTVGIHASDATLIPQAVPLGAPVTEPWVNLSLTYLWHEFPFAGVKATDLNVRDYCLVVKGPDTVPAYVRELWDKSAPDNGVVERWSTDGGGSWDPRSNAMHKQDFRFYVYGQWVTAAPVGTSYDRKFVKGVEITVLVGPDTSARALTAVELLNAPEIPVP